MVFDFDCTIAREHLWGTHGNADLDSIPITDDTFVDLPAFRAFVAAARERGHKLAVATFGRREVVEKALCYALGEDHGLPVSTPADFGCTEGSADLGSKNAQLDLLAAELGVPLARIVLLDDDPNNVRQAARHGASSRHAPHGLTRRLLGEAEALLGL